MSLLDHVVAVIEPVAGRDEVAELARKTVVAGGRATVLLRLSPAFRADIDRFAASEELDFGTAQEIALERLTERYRQMIDPGAAVLPIADGARLPLEHPALADATAVIIDASSVTYPALQLQLSQSPVPVVLAPAGAPTRSRTPVGVG